MDYRVAKQIRGAKFSDLMAANIVKGDSTFESFKKSLSQKSKARATKIKEKFDPLNIAKFLTGGSKLAPAILGRLMGRSQRDIEYFSGTARLIGGKNTRIGTTNKQGMELSILTDIYEFLNKSYEFDKKQRDSQSDYAEEREAEDEKRHKQLIEAIQKSKGTVSPITKEKETDGFLSMLKSMFEAFKKTVVSLVMSAITNLFGGLKVLKTLLSFLGSKAFGFLTGPLFTKLLTFLNSSLFRLFLGPLGAASSIIALVLLLAEAMKWAIGKLPDFTVTQEQALNFIQNASEYDKQKLATIFRGGMAELEEIAVGGKDTAKAILDSGDENAIEAAGGRALLERVVSGTVAPVKEKPNPRPLSPPGANPDLRTGAQIRWDNQNAGILDPITGLKLKPGDEVITAPKDYKGPPQVNPAPVVPPAPQTMGGVFNRVSGANTTPLSLTPVSKAGTVSPAPANITSPSVSAPAITNSGTNTATPMDSTYKNVSGVTDLNRNLNQNNVPAQRPPYATKTVQVEPVNKTSDALRIMPAVRNMDDTFQRMIYNSIRVV